MSARDETEEVGIPGPHGAAGAAGADRDGPPRPASVVLRVTVVLLVGLLLGLALTPDKEPPSEERRSERQPESMPALVRAPDPASDASRPGLQALTPTEWFESLDTTRDGVVSGKEIGRFHLFAMLDEDRNDLLDSEELGVLRRLQLIRPGIEVPMQRSAIPGAGIFYRLDADSDHQLSSAELVPLLEAMHAEHEGARSSDHRDAGFIRPLLGFPGEHGVGRLIPDVEFQDIHGKHGALSDHGDALALVIAMTDTECPQSKRYSPILARLERRYADRPVEFLYINVNDTALPSDMKSVISTHGFRGPYVHDSDQHIRRVLGVTSTAEVLVLDAARTLIYRGAVDDQYGIGYELPQARHHFLADALDAVLSGRRPTVGMTSAPGCLINPGKAEGIEREVTYHNGISRIIQANCQQCHRTGGVAPFPLETQSQVEARASMIAYVVKQGLMPPWPASRAEHARWTPWVNDRTLATADREDLISWLDSTRPSGNPDDAPRPLTFGTQWQIGVPDAIVRIPEPIQVQAEGVMPYVNVRVPTDFGEDVWIRAVELRPSARDQVHHLLVYPLPDSEGNDDWEPPLFDGTGDGPIATYFPGNDHVVYPETMGRLLRRGTTLHFQFHFATNGTVAEEMTELGLRFFEKEPELEVRTTSVRNPEIVIPAHAPHHREFAVKTLTRPINVIAVWPHMHSRGSAMRVDLDFPGGERRTLLRVPNYDFYWQIAYRLFEPIHLPAGTRIITTGWFDNSAGNPANPDPTAQVNWGRQTYDEMLVCMFEYYFDEQ